RDQVDVIDPLEQAFQVGGLIGTPEAGVHEEWLLGRRQPRGEGGAEAAVRVVAQGGQRGGLRLGFSRHGSGAVRAAVVAQQYLRTAPETLQVAHPRFHQGRQGGGLVVNRKDDAEGRRQDGGQFLRLDHGWLSRS